MSIRLSRRTLMRLTIPSTLVLAAALGACSSDETGPEAHIPASVKLFVNGVDETANLTLPAGATTRIVLKFYDAADAEMSTIETEHFSTMTFTADTLATVADVAGHHFQKDVTAQAAPGTGTVMVGFGHDALADEESFGPFPVTVE